MSNRHSFISTVMVAIALTGIAACGKSPTADTPAAVQKPVSDLRPVASVLDLMLGQIAPAADLLWGAVATVSGPNGVEEKQPRTDAEWAEVRFKALQISEAANLLLVEGRQVAHPGQQLKEPGDSTSLTPAQAQIEIEKDRASFVAFSHALQDAAGLVVTAVNKRSAEALEEAGGNLDAACESCHMRFWYPNAPATPGA